MKAETRRVSVEDVLPAQAGLALAADVYLPVDAKAPAAALFCLPGGGMTRGYFDLAAPGRSFAGAMTARGFAVVALDSLGWGESSRPRDGFALVPEAIAAANAQAVDALAGELEARWPGLPRIGVGHSLGALLAIVQQAEHESFDALVLLGATTRGLRVVLSDEELAYADRPEAARAELVRLARRRSGGEAWFELPNAARAGAVLDAPRLFRALGRARAGAGLPRRRRARHHRPPARAARQLPGKPRNHALHPTRRRPQPLRLPELRGAVRESGDVH